MFFCPTYLNVIICNINELNFNKSSSPDEINTEFIMKSSVLVIAPVLTALCNGYLKFNLFCSCLKIAKVIPNLKANNNIIHTTD